MSSELEYFIHSAEGLRMVFSSVARPTDEVSSASAALLAGSCVKAVKAVAQAVRLQLTEVPTTSLLSSSVRSH